jgi:hypothetical protein
MTNGGDREERHVEAMVKSLHEAFEDPGTADAAGQLAEAAMGDETASQPTHVHALFRAWQDALGRYREVDQDSPEAAELLRHVNRSAAAYQKAVADYDRGDGPG